MTKETIDSRQALGLPRIRIFGLALQDSIARRIRSCSRALIVCQPTASLSWNTSPARIDPMMAGVPPSSRWTGSAR